MAWQKLKNLPWKGVWHGGLSGQIMAAMAGHGGKSGLKLFCLKIFFWTYFRDFWVLKWNPKSLFKTTATPLLLYAFLSLISVSISARPLPRDPSDRQRPDSGDATCRWSSPSSSGDLKPTSGSVILPLFVLLFCSFCFFFCSIRFPSSILSLSALLFFFFSFSVLFQHPFFFLPFLGSAWSPVFPFFCFVLFQPPPPPISALFSFLFFSCSVSAPYSQ